MTRLQSKTRWKRSARAEPLVLSNKFVSIAPLWFYKIVTAFIEHREKEEMWTGFSGSQFLANLFRCLAVIVEFSGISCHAVLAQDLLELVWPFINADIAEIRTSVLVAIATSLSMLPEDRVLMLLLQEPNYQLPQIVHTISSMDPDKDCRILASFISQTIAGVTNVIGGAA